MLQIFNEMCIYKYICSIDLCIDAIYEYPSILLEVQVVARPPFKVVPLSCGNSSQSLERTAFCTKLNGYRNLLAMF